MKGKLSRGRKILYLTGAVSALISFALLCPKNSELILDTPVHVLETESCSQPSGKIAPEDVSVFLDSELYCRNAYLCLADTRSVIAEKESGEKVSPASLTKIMTTVVLLENAVDLDAKVTVPSEIYDELYRNGAAMAGFLPGEVVSLKDLVYGIMLPSGAEAAAAAAEYVFGGQDKLVEKMNIKALEMGLSNTHFENIYGFDEEGHYSNAAELAQILMYAIKNETFCEIVQNESYSVPPTNKHPQGFTMKSTVFSKIGDAAAEEAVILGGKTGYTYDAGLCLATYATKDNRVYVAVVLGVEGNHRTKQYQVDDTIYLYNLI